MKKTVNNELEDLLRNSADGIRLHPSPKVWKQINARLHRRKRVYAAAGMLLLLLTLTVAVYNPSARNSNTIAGAQQNGAKNTKNDIANNNNGVDVLTKNTATTFTPASLTDAAMVTGTNIQRTGPVNRTQNNRTGDAQPVTRNETILPVEEVITAPVTMVQDNEKQQSAVQPAVTASITENNNTVIRNDLGNSTEPAENRNEEPVNNSSSAASFTNAQKNEPAENNNMDKIATGNVNNANKNIPPKKTDKQEQLPVKEIAGNIQVKQRQRRVTTEFYAFPSISYRKLTDSRDKTDPNATSKEDFDKAVYHKPSMGLEAGISWHYRIYDNFRAKAGIQVNYNRFNMKATLAPQPEVATIVLYGNNQDIYNTSNLRTGSDRGLPEWLKNKNVQISLPVGFEVALTPPSRANTTLNIGATAQPSYLLGNKNYLLSTDLKNYTTEPSLIRRFNLNFGFETFFAFETNKLRWHIGPQLRYQLFSTYNKPYPIRENLIDYTFKVSISKPF